MTELPLIFAFIILASFAAALEQLLKKLIKKCLPKFYKSKLYDILKLTFAVILCLIIAICTPNFIFGLVGIENINLLSKIWLGVFSGLLSNIGFATLKGMLKMMRGDPSINDRPNRDDEE